MDATMVNLLWVKNVILLQKHSTLMTYRIVYLLVVPLQTAAGGICYLSDDSCTLLGDCPPYGCKVTAWILSLCKTACLVACWRLQNICMLLSRGSNSLGKIPHSPTNNHHQCFHPRTSDHLDLAPQFHHFSCCRIFAADMCPYCYGCGNLQNIIKVP